MAKKEENVEPEIIRIVKKGHGGHHGGSWKVAYADFVTAMMAFFLLLWLLSMVSKEKKILLSQYFNNVSLSNVKGGLPFMESGSRNLTEEQHDLITSLSVDSEKISEKMPGGKPVMSEIEKALVSKLMEIADQVRVNSAEEGVRIEIGDTEKSRLFQPGGAVLTDNAKKIIHAVADNIKGHVTRLSIESHSETFKDQKEDSAWEMSLARAMAVRAELEASGVNPFSIEKIISYGDRLLVDKANPGSVVNNRVNIVLLDNSRKDKSKEDGNGAPAPAQGAAGAGAPAPATH
ncbi:MAG: OmpA family protein [Nitrospinae bacterium]|nr:OmpA family protein [Nitrospinota bacterium]